MGRSFFVPCAFSWIILHTELNVSDVSLCIPFLGYDSQLDWNADEKINVDVRMKVFTKKII